MGERLAGKTSIVVGAGQTPGYTVGNGRAVALLMAREGATVLVADRDLHSAQETVDIIASEGGEAIAVQVDVTNEDEVRAMTAKCLEQWGRIDILHNNVGVAVGDAPVVDIDVARLAQILAVNLQGMVLTAKHALPSMRRAGRGVITNISSNAVLIDYVNVAYKTSKAGVVSLTEHLAIRNAEFGIRANVILPGLMETPMAVEHRVGVGGKSREEILAERHAKTPLRGRAGTAWDVANASVFLASDEASFITGAQLVIDGGQSLKVG